MANTTDEFWEVDGVSLSQHGWNVSTIGGARYDVPPLRGEDQQYAYVPGQQFRPKIPDSRTITLVMWTTGTVPHSGAVVDDPAKQWNDNWQFLRKLFWTPNRQLTLTRRWRLDNGDGGSQIVVASAQAQLASTLEPTMTGRHRAEFTVDLRLADPFFYGDEIEQEIVPDVANFVHNPGDYTAAHMHFEVEFHSNSGDVFRNPRLTNSTPTPDVWLQLSGHNTAGTEVGISTPNYVTFDVAAFTAVASSPDHGSLMNSLGRTQFAWHAGARQWMGLLPGENSLAITATLGAGYAVVRFRPPYI